MERWRSSGTASSTSTCFTASSERSSEAGRVRRMPERPSPSRRMPLVLMAIALIAIGIQPAARAQRAPGPLHRVRVEAPPGQTLLVHGTYPQVDSSCVGPEEQPVLHGRHRGTIEVRRSADGSLFVIGELRFEDYVKG